MQVDLQEKLKLLPTKPGVYLMKNDAGEVIYVGKAVSLRHRVRSYFQSGRAVSPKVAALVENVAGLEYIVTDSEVEALILESNLIKEYEPRYNVRLKDDKAYPYLKVTLDEPFPRIAIVRRVKKDGSRYFGPYTNVQAVRQSLKFLRKVFPIRTCRREIGPEGGSDRPCLNYHIQRCLAPCAGKVDRGKYRQVIEEVMLVLEGRHDLLLKELQERMQAAARELKFEEAARIRDQIRALEKVVEEQKIVSDRDIDQDVIGYARAGTLVCVQVFLVRSGKLIGREHFFLEATCEEEESEILTAFVEQYYGGASFVPKELLLPGELQDAELIARWLSELKGSRVYLRVPRRGEKKRLVDMVQRNAALVLEERRSRQDRKAAEMQQGMAELQEYLGLDKLPRRIEGYDISNIQGNEAVGSMVVLLDGEPAPGEYRRFKIRCKQTPDDFAMMREVVYRRFARGLKEQGPFAQFPDLVLIDGGKGQLNAARSAMRELGVDYIPVVGLAKKLEEIYREDEKDPLILPRNSQGLYMVQRLRDEAHRFAITYHRQLRGRRATKSVLDEIPGVGPKRKKELIKHFGSVRGVREASLEELRQVPGLPEAVAERIYQELRD